MDAFWKLIWNKSVGIKIWYHENAGYFPYSPTKKYFWLWCFSPCIIILNACLIIWTVIGEIDVDSAYTRTLVKFVLYLQRTFVLLGKRSPDHAENFVSAFLSKTFVLYTSTTLHYFLNSLIYRLFSYWALKLSTLSTFVQLLLCDLYFPPSSVI